MSVETLNSAPIRPPCAMVRYSAWTEGLFLTFDMWRDGGRGARLLLRTRQRSRPYIESQKWDEDGADFEPCPCLRAARPVGTGCIVFANSAPSWIAPLESTREAKSRMTPARTRNVTRDGNISSQACSHRSRSTLRQLRPLVNHLVGHSIPPWGAKSFVAVGMPIAWHPPHKTVRARLRIRLPPWMCGDKACIRIRMQDTRGRNPSVEERIEPLPTHIAALTATDQYHPPQPAKPMPKDLQLRHVTRNRVISVIA